MIQEIVLFQPIIYLQIGVGWWCINYLLAHDRGPKEPPRILLLAGVLGAAGVAAAIALELWLVSSKLTADNPAAVHHLSFSFLLFNCFLIGLIEEIAKAGPLTAFIYKKGYFNEMTDALIYWGIAGMVFGVIEDISYTLSLGPAAGIAKIITGPFSHAGFTVLIGWMVARHKLLHKPAWNIPLGFALAIGLHMLYDFGLFYSHAWSLLLSLAITVGINTFLFLLYRRASRIDVERGFSSAGPNLYCRQCGWPNPRHYMFCVQCGQKA